MSHKTDVVTPRPLPSTGHGTFDIFGPEDGLSKFPRNRTQYRCLAAVGLVVCASLTIAVVVLAVLLSIHVRNSWQQQLALAPNRISDSLLGNYSTFGAAADNGECSAIAREVMLRGGNAVDATVAADMCIGVMTAHSCGIGGGFFMVLYNSTTKHCIAVDARETAPLSATKSMFENKPKNISQTGWLSIAVPGELHGLYTVHRQFGRLPWADLLRPTINLLRNGHTVSPPLADAIREYAPVIMAEKSMRDVFFNKATKRLVSAGDRLKRPRLADTFERLAEAEDPIKLFYEGAMAVEMVDEFQKNGGILTLDDFRNYRTKISAYPSMVKLSSGLSVCGPPEPSGGPVALAILSIIDGYNFSPANLETAEQSADAYHKITEAMKFGYSMRSYLGDPDFVKNAAEIAKNITTPKWAEYVRSRITDTSHPTSYYGGSYEGVDDHGTSHFSVIDAEGNSVSLTSTINLKLGARVISNSTGILWNDEMDDFSSVGVINYFGISPSKANFIEPGKRPMSSMCPIIVYNETSGQVRLSIGAAGGSNIITGTAYATIRDLWFGENIKQAIDAPRIHHQLLPVDAQMETKFMPAVVVDLLKAKGQNITSVNVAGSRVYGVERRDGRILAICDYRKPGGFTGGE